MVDLSGAHGTHSVRIANVRSAGVCRQAAKRPGYTAGVRLLLYSVRAGRGHSREAEALTAEYLKRVRSPFAAEARVLKTEAQLLDAVAVERKAGATSVWLLDSRGKAISSEDWAAALRTAQNAGRRALVLAIGPADGWSAAALAGDVRPVSLGPMTLPHELARIVAAEQLYRATTILAGHPYHLGHE